MAIEVSPYYIVLVKPRSLCWPAAQCRDYTWWTLFLVKPTSLPAALQLFPSRAIFFFALLLVDKLLGRDHCLDLRLPLSSGFFISTSGCDPVLIATCYILVLEILKIYYSYSRIAVILCVAAVNGGPL